MAGIDEFKGRICRQETQEVRKTNPNLAAIFTCEIDLCLTYEL